MRSTVRLVLFGCVPRHVPVIANLKQPGLLCQKTFMESFICLKYCSNDFKWRWWYTHFWKLTCPELFSWQWTGAINFKYHLGIVFVQYHFLFINNLKHILNYILFVINFFRAFYSILFYNLVFISQLRSSSFATLISIMKSGYKKM